MKNKPSEHPYPSPEQWNRMLRVHGSQTTEELHGLVHHWMLCDPDNPDLRILAQLADDAMKELEDSLDRLE